MADRTVVLGYSRIGYLMRARGFIPLPADALAGRVALVTGGSAGLGLATAEGLARLGARVRLVVRDTARGEAACVALRARVPTAELAVTRCDVSDLDDVRRAADELVAAAPDVLVHNAGVLPPARTVTAQGHELTLATHVLGPHLMTRLLADALAPDGRVIVVSSGGMYTQRLTADEPEPYSGTVAYARTKRMQVVLAGEWARHLAAGGVTVHAVHPGWADTPGLTSSLPGFRGVLGPVLRTATEGADTTVWLAGAPASEIGSGRFWHDRRARPEHYLPWTRETAADRARLWAWCERVTA